MNKAGADFNAKALWDNLAALRAKAPLVHNITNYVVMNSTANGLLALGASPLMAHAPEELEDMVAIAGALVINMGTLSAPWVESMRLAQGLALKRGIPVVFDPVGAGASRYRTSTARDLLHSGPPTVIRGNASEIMALAAGSGATKGVDSTDAAESALDAARALAAQNHCVVVISGATDYIVQAGRVAYVQNGHPLMAKVTGMGCLSTTYVAAFAATLADPFEAGVSAMAVMGITGELAAQHCAGPGSFWSGFLDQVYGLDAAACSRLKAGTQ
jgi:hydroxyethylthiazole kinase